jgi:hypothetical protein
MRDIQRYRNRAATAERRERERTRDKAAPSKTRTCNSAGTRHMRNEISSYSLKAVSYALELSRAFSNSAAAF